MRNFSQLVTEERKNHDSVSLLQSEITNYINKVNKILPQNIKDIIAIANRFNLGSANDLDKIRFSNKSQLAKLSIEMNIPKDQLETLYTLLKQASKNIRLLPQYQSEAERAAIEAGKLAIDDLTIDLETQQGRNAAAKMYTPLVLKIVNQYVGKSRLDRPSLISVGMEGLASAINNWSKNSDGQKTTFKTYASYRIQQAILNEINANGHDLSGGNWYNVDKYGAAAFDAVSLDHMNNDDDDSDFDSSHISALGVDLTDMDKNIEKEESNWQTIFKILDNKFSSRDMDIFYRYFGLGPYHGKRQKSKDITKEYNMSEGNIRNSIINKIIKFIQTDPHARKVIISLRSIYTESLLGELINMDKNMIREALYRDTTYIMLEEITRWENKQDLIHTVHAACDKMNIEEAKFIFDCLMKGEEFIRTNIRKNRKLVVFFLGEVYPAENMRNKNDKILADYMLELADATIRLKIDW